MTSGQALNECSGASLPCSAGKSLCSAKSLVGKAIFAQRETTVQIMASVSEVTHELGSHLGSQCLINTLL